MDVRLCRQVETTAEQGRRTRITHQNERSLQGIGQTPPTEEKLLSNTCAVPSVHLQRLKGRLIPENTFRQSLQIVAVYGPLAPRGRRERGMNDAIFAGNQSIPIPAMSA